MKVYRLIAAAFVLTSILSSCGTKGRDQEEAYLNSDSSEVQNDVNYSFARSEPTVYYAPNDERIFDNTQVVIDAPETLESTTNAIVVAPVVIRKHHEVRDEAAGSMKRAGAGISGGIRALGKKVSDIIYPE